MTEEEVAHCKAMMLSPIKEVAEMYVTPLLREGILRVAPDKIKVMDLVIPRNRVVYFHIALTGLRSGATVKQSEKGYTYETVTLVDGNDTERGYKITSNVEGEGHILLTRDIAWELWEVVAFFIPEIPKETLVKEQEDAVGSNHDVQTD